VPDVSFIASRRIPQDASGRIADDFRIAPDLAIEIVSPKEALTDLEEKLSLCVRNGCRLGIMVDPYSETLQVFRPDAPPRRLGSGPIDLGPVIPGLQLTVADVFGWLRPRR
jgi:Uma2 family endonuclease